VPDPFQTLGLPRSFSVDAAGIDQAYFARSAALHPDIAAADPEAPRRMAALNEARAVLSDPERRADALLLALGGPSRQQHKELPPGFLMDIMDIREQIEAAVGDRGQRQQWEAWAAQRRAQAMSEVGAMFSLLGPSPAPEALAAIRTRLNAWRYIERLIEQLDPEYTPARADFR
jgi:molecular chaperone HscB